MFVMAELNGHYGFVCFLFVALLSLKILNF